jgi:hypothetical protein
MQEISYNTDRVGLDVLYPGDSGISGRKWTAKMILKHYW